MITVSKSDKNGVLYVQLKGTIEEGIELEKAIGPVGNEVIIGTKEVSRLNSAGIVLWIQYFQKLQKQKIKVTLAECSPPIVEQMNLIRNFTCGAQVQSVYAPFACRQCKNQFVNLFGTEELKKVLSNLPQPPCPKCGAKMEFDDIPDEYFEFLTR
jgi:anti-anti-sigma regulatory factor